MHIRILTIHDIGNNYGSAIQSCALSEYLNGLGHDAKLINYTPDYRSHSARVRTRLAEALYREEVKKRRACFSAYYEKHARLTRRIRSIDRLEPQPEDTVWMIGSDQVWNPHFPCGRDGAYTLSFVPGGRKLAYGASAGCELTDAECAALYEKISGFAAVSFRESRTTEQMKSRLPEAVTVLDPVFLKTREQYLSETAERLIPEDYLLIYAINGDPLMDRAIGAYREAHPGIRTVLVGGLRKKCETDVFLRDIGPAEFLTLLRDARHVLVSSFHGLALSVILRKDVSVVEPTLSKLRLRDFAERAGLTDRFLTESDLTALARPVDYETVNRAVEAERTASAEYLKNALEKTASVEPGGAPCVKRGRIGTIRRLIGRRTEEHGTADR